MNDLTLEKMEINKRLQALETGVALLVLELRTSRQKIEELLYKHDGHILGDASLDKPGLVLRVDRLEQAATSRRWLWGSVIALLGEHLRHIFFGGK